MRRLPARWERRARGAEDTASRLRAIVPTDTARDREPPKPMQPRAPIPASHGVADWGVEVEADG